MIKVNISTGNTKMGHIPSVSLPPVESCRPGCPCAKKCYAVKISRIRPNVAACYRRNLDAWRSDPKGYALQVAAAAITTRYFRWHVAGDIPDDTYFQMMCKVAIDCPGTNFLAFTKRWDIVNPYADRIPHNLQVIYSAWGDLLPENPHELPVAHVIFRGAEPDPSWKICGGNCTDCICKGIGCWELQRGEHIAFYEH